MMRRYFCYMFVFGLLAAVLAGQADGRNKVTLKSLLNEMIDRDRIARLPSPGYRCKQASSYDRSQTGPDNPATWFNNNDYDQFIRLEEKGGRKEYVIMEDTGPGCLTRWWAPLLPDRKNQTVRIYLDGDDKPVIEENYHQFMSGLAFVKPPFAFVASDESTMVGADMYLPIPFLKSCKITLDGLPFFYVINYRKYEPGTNVESFTMPVYHSARKTVQRVGKMLTESGNVDSGKKITQKQTVAPGAEMSVKLPDGSFEVHSLQLKLDADTDGQTLRSTVLQFTFDGQQTVWCPVSEFFGGGVYLHPAQNWNQSVTEEGILQSYWIMPYQKTASLVVKNYGETPVNVAVTVTVGKAKWREDSMYFHANWRQENFKVTSKSDWNYIEIQGKGVYVGDTLTAFSPAKEWWGEGDEKIYIDGEKTPSHMGTGLEDYYGYAWGMANNFSTPFISVPLRDVHNRGDWRGYTTVSRRRLLDGIPFATSLKVDVEAWLQADDVSYAAAMFWYAHPEASCNRSPDIEGCKITLPKFIDLVKLDEK